MDWLLGKKTWLVLVEFIGGEPQGLHLAQASAIKAKSKEEALANVISELKRSDKPIRGWAFDLSVSTAVPLEFHDELKGKYGREES